MSKKTVQVLLIEDDPVAAGVFEAQLSADFTTRYEAELVGNLAGGVQRLGETNYDVIVLDLLLPDARGLEALEELVLLETEIPIVVLTSLDDEEVAAKALQSGAQDYLVKGEIHGRLVARSIRYAIERHRLTQALRSMALIDEGTGLYNRRGFSNLAAQTLNTARRRKQGVALISVALEEALKPGAELESGIVRPIMRRLASLLRDTFRASDLLARVGDREFVVLAIQGDRKGAKIAVSRFEASLENGSGNGSGVRYPIRVGLDWISSDDLPTPESLLGRYDSVEGPTRELRFNGGLSLPPGSD